MAFLDVRWHGVTLSDFELALDSDCIQLLDIGYGLQKRVQLHVIGIVIGNRSEPFILTELVLEVDDESNIGSMPHRCVKSDGCEVGHQILSSDTTSC